jgi:hypothetical protein
MKDTGKNAAYIDWLTQKGNGNRLPRGKFFQNSVMPYKIFYSEHTKLNTDFIEFIEKARSLPISK